MFQSTSNSPSMHRLSWPFFVRYALALGCLIWLIADPCLKAQDGKPILLDEDWELRLVVSEPELVTPISCRFDSKGRLLVVESHTHFPAATYQGPKTDRIYLFDQLPSAVESVTQPQPRKRLFYEGGRATMGLAVLKEDWIAVSTRSEVIKIRDGNGDDVADQREVLLTLETKAEYPHNGLGGIALGPDGMLYVGQGENLGADYKLIGSDGSVQTGGGEGGNIFRCTTNGAKLERVATGFWNPFGLYFDPAGRLWTVENDPDARPPCRLLQVIPGGDYGFQFRFGRAGTNPLIAWNGELPGTLPMVSGTGEAPCSLVGYDGALWVTSWGCNRIERYRMEPKGASWIAKMDIMAQGDANFRPVDMSIAPDGSLYFTDWVDRNYSVHGKGRLWRLNKRKGKEIQTGWPALRQQELRAKELLSEATRSNSARASALDDSDPFIRQAAIHGLGNGDPFKNLSWDTADTTGKQLGFLLAGRWQELNSPDSVTAAQRSNWIEHGLQSNSTEVKMVALRWATERNEKDKLPTIRGLLLGRDLTPDLFACAISSIAYLESGSAAQGQRDPIREKLLYEFSANANQPLKIRAAAIRLIPSEAELPTDKELFEWSDRFHDRQFGGEIVRLLAARATPSATDLLAAISSNENLNEQVRADALAGLVKKVSDYRASIEKLALPSQTTIVRTEAKRVLQTGLTVINQSQPQSSDLQAWDMWLGSNGDADAGRRVFFRTTCANCHAHSGRGSRVGPDLTKLAGQMTRERILESILSPSREVAPLYVPFRVLTVDDKTLVGMRLETSGASDKMHFLGADGVAFQVRLADIEKVEPAKQSIMPNGLEATMSQTEFSDLIRFLLTE